MKHVAIIGNGISGITAARWIRKMRSDWKITVISKETDHFYSRCALMYIYMGHMRYKDTKPYEDYFWEKNRIDLVRGCVEKIDPDNKELHFDDGNKLNYDVLILGVGSTYNKFGWPGEDLKGVGGMYSYQDLLNIEKYTKGIKRGVVVGGGLIGIELAEMIHSRNIPVTFLVREDKYWNKVLPPKESELVERHIREHGIDLQMETELKEILPDENGRVKAVLTGKGEEIPCGFVGLTAGVRPNVEFLENTGIETDKGILVDHYFATNVPDVYAVGDCVQFREPLPGRLPLEQIWYTGRMHGENVALNICGQKTKYQPGVWFNSAKFFDIEYQNYGWIQPEMLQKEKSFYWEDKTGRKCFRVVWSKETGNLLGFNLLGIRFRHEVCESWIKEKKDIDFVMEHLPAVNFDPEFYKQHEPEILAKFNQENGKNLQIQVKKGLFSKIFQS